jgi:hypothetical protein
VGYWQNSEAQFIMFNYVKSVLESIRASVHLQEFSAECLGVDVKLILDIWNQILDPWRDGGGRGVVRIKALALSVR